MKRDFLKELGLASEIIDKIMVQYGEDVEKLKAENKRIETLEKEIEDKNNKISSLLDQNKELDDLKLKLSQIQDEKKQAEDKFSLDLRNLKINNAVEKALSNAKAKNQKLVMPLLKDFLETAELDGNGNVKDLDQKIKQLTEHDDTSFLFDSPVFITGQTPGNKADNITNQQNTDYKNMTYEQICDALNKKTL